MLADIPYGEAKPVTFENVRRGLRADTCSAWPTTQGGIVLNAGDRVRNWTLEAGLCTAWATRMSPAPG